MRNTTKTAAAAILAGAMMLVGTAAVNAQMGINDTGGVKASKVFGTTHVRSNRQARADVRAQQRAWNNGWNNGPLAWPGAAAAGAGFVAGTAIGGAANATGAIVGAPFGAYAYDRNGSGAFVRGQYGAYPEYDSGGNAIFLDGPRDGTPCSLNLKQLNRC